MEARRWNWLSARLQVKCGEALMKATPGRVSLTGLPKIMSVTAARLELMAAVRVRFAPLLYSYTGGLKVDRGRGRHRR